MNPLKRFFILAVPFITTGMVSCSLQEETANTPGQQAVRFSILSVRSAEDHPAETYFTASGKASVSSPDMTVEYIWSEGNLQGQDEGSTIYFPIDGTPISQLSVRWPDDAVRASAGESVTRDQSTETAFLLSDWLSATLSDVNYTGTDIPITLEHERTCLVFLAGGALEGKKITSLKIGEYTAWCSASADMKGAQLILSENDEIPSGTLGVLTVEGEETGRNFTIGEMPETAPGSSHDIVITF